MLLYQSRALEYQSESITPPERSTLGNNLDYNTHPTHNPVLQPPHIGTSVLQKSIQTRKALAEKIWRAVYWSVGTDSSRSWGGRRDYGGGQKRGGFGSSWTDAVSVCRFSQLPFLAWIKPPAHIHSCFRDSILSFSLYEDIKNELDLTRSSNIRWAPCDILHYLYLLKNIKIKIK